MFKQPIIYSYDPCFYEDYPGVYPTSKPYSADAYRKVLFERINYEKEQKRLVVNSYRVHRAISYPLPVVDFPALEYRGGGYDGYGYSIYLSWRLRERWDTLHAAVETYDDKTALTILTKEIRLLASWPQFSEQTQLDHLLPLGHYAICFAKFLRLRTCPQEDKEVIESGARRLLNEFLMPAVTEKLSSAITPDRAGLHNILNIALVGAAALASVLGEGIAETIWDKVYEVITVLNAARFDAEKPFSEGPCYDSFFLVHLTAAAVLAEQQEKFLIFEPLFASMVTDFITMSLPGRADFFAPHGDVEPQMQFSQICAMHYALWYPDKADNAVAYLSHIPPTRMLPDVLCFIANSQINTIPLNGPALHVNPAAIAMRSGYNICDTLCGISFGHCMMGHLHYDAGSITISKNGRLYITDPGYQQYYDDNHERDFTVGLTAHNVPVIDGCAQTLRGAFMVSYENNRVLLDISACYGYETGSVLREINFGKTLVTVSDSFSGLKAAMIEYHFHLGTNTAASLCKTGTVSVHAEGEGLYIQGETKGVPLPFSPVDMLRHPGSRGPNYIYQGIKLTNDKQSITWKFEFKEDA